MLIWLVVSTLMLLLLGLVAAVGYLLGVPIETTVLYVLLVITAVSMSAGLLKLLRP